MRIVGLVQTSLVDWDGKICSVIFLGGCNFYCPYCHNSEIARDSPELPEISWEQVASTIARGREKHKLEWHDGITVTGGEPMMHPEVFSLCRRIKELGLLVKLDTNGSFPYPLKRLIEQGLCDFVAMDIKAPLGEKYSLAAGRKVELVPIERSIRLLKESGVDYEFRSTLVPGLIDPVDIPEVGRAIEGAKVLVLQQFEPSRAPSKSFRERKPYSRAQAEAMAEILKPFVKEVRLRGKLL